MKDFAKSIVCNSVTEKEFNTEADLRRWCMDHNYTYTPVGGGYYRLEDDKPGSKRPDLEAHVKAGNSKCGNAYQYAGSIPIEKIPDNWRPEFPKAGYVVYYAPNKAKWFATEAEAKRFAESQDKAQKTGNSKVGNADKFSGNYIIMSDDGNVWFRDEHEDVSIRSIDSWAQKRIAEYQRSINEIQKGVQEAKQAAKKFGLL